MTDFTYGTRPGAIAALTTELNALGSATLSAAGPAITPGTTTNLTVRVQRGDLILKLASSSMALTATSFVAVYFLTAIDGTNYPKISGNNVARANYRVGTIALYPATLSTEVIYEGILGVRIPNVPFKVALENLTGVAFPSSGNTLDLWPQADGY